ncbi:LacI family DNA-binding transcriptional regulator [Pelagicoccus sp. SDUM812005]|uniref:LacI family DNA-binding transcriptional regulator n=1 Tax=Pelagicoccus sp. SDUM812005 TaxID=3041257 RepID=UPI00280DA508|nr:LacI family DNA-binding transcriptional regulator [Pelagicoccus sp. SDUM812005]MDQ8181611.1 LacI family DNA-binding transcriptional regulator [Pelagicoccus sp. SDUM812005]
MPKAAPKKTRSKSSKPTIQDVANELGISVYAVSRTLNNSSGVNSEMRERILATSRRLGVKPRPPKRQIQIALAMTNGNDYWKGGYVMNVTFELLRELSSRNIGLTVFSDDQVDQLCRQIFDGVFVFSWDETVLERLSAIKDTPMVAINRFSLSDRFHVVGWDHVAEGRAVANYLIERGHQRTGIVTVHPSSQDNTQSRVEGFSESLAAAGKKFDPTLLEIIEAPENLVPALARLVDRQVDSIYFPGQERLGILALNTLQRIMKVRVPEDISVIAGEIPNWSDITDPPLTTIDVPYTRIAKRCADHILRLIEKRETEASEVFLETRIIERRTVIDRRPS